MEGKEEGKSGRRGERWEEEERKGVGREGKKREERIERGGRVYASKGIQNNKPLQHSMP